MEQIIKLLAKELEKPEKYIENVISLLDEGNTIPFIARYRKELHGSMDDTTLRTLETRLQYLRGLQERRETICKAIESQGKLTESLKKSLDSAQTLSELEDLYRPYKQNAGQERRLQKKKAWNRWQNSCFPRKKAVPDRKRRRSDL